VEQERTRKARALSQMESSVVLLQRELVLANLTMPKFVLNGTSIDFQPEKQDQSVSGGIIQEGKWEDGMVSALCKKFGEGFGNFMHIGANIGTSIPPMSKCLQGKGRVIAIVAMPSVTSHLKASSVFVKTLDPGDKDASTESLNKGHDGDKHVNVPVATLDALLQNEPAMKSLLAAKIDMEDNKGATLMGSEEFLGAEEFFTKYPPCYLQIEQTKLKKRDQLLSGMFSPLSQVLNLSGYAFDTNHHTPQIVTSFFQQRNMVACVNRVRASLNLASPQLPAQTMQPVVAAAAAAAASAAALLAKNVSQLPAKTIQPVVAAAAAVAASATALMTKKASQSPLDPSSVSMSLYVLTVPSLQKSIMRRDRFITGSKQRGFTGAHAVQPIHGVAASKFYSNHDGLDVSMKWGGWVNKSAHFFKLDANRKIFEAFNEQMREESMSSPVYPKQYMNASENRLHPGQIACALGHRHFWMKTAALPDHAWGIVFEDDSTLRGTPSRLAKILQSVEVGCHASRACFNQAPKGSNIVYLGGCQKSESGSMRDFFRDTIGYALKPAMARKLLKKARGNIPVDWAIKEVVGHGMCANFVDHDVESHRVSLIGKF